MLCKIIHTHFKKSVTDLSTKYHVIEGSRANTFSQRGYFFKDKPQGRFKRMDRFTTNQNIELRMGIVEIMLV
jgi:hypothetical protein